MSGADVHVTAVAQTMAAPWWEGAVQAAAAGMPAAFVTGLFLMAVEFMRGRNGRKTAQADVSEKLSSASDKMSSSWDRIVSRVETENQQLFARVHDAEALIGDLKKDLHARNNWISACRAYVDRVLRWGDECVAEIQRLGGTPPERPVLPELPDPPSAT